MWILIAVFIVALISWSGVLWLILSIDIFDYSMLAIVGMHLAPPLIVVAIWISIRYWRKRRLASREHELKEVQEKEREVERDRQKKIFDEALQQRRIAIECRWTAANDLISQIPGLEYIVDTEQTRTYQTFSRAVGSATTHPWPYASLLPMLKDLYMQAPIAGGLPIAFCGPSSSPNADIAQIMRAAHLEALREVSITPRQASIFDVFPLPVRGQSIYRALLDLFVSHPDLPGVVVVAFDSIAGDAAGTDDWPISEEAKPLHDAEKYCGKPGRALIVQLLTPTVLTSALEKIDVLADDVPLDAMTPHWERQRIPVGMAGWLVEWPKSQRDALAALAPVAFLHASASTTLATNLLSARCRQQAASAVLEAAINADLFTPSFAWTDETNVEREKPSPQAAVEIENCGWIVHNAGDISCCGDRLALLFYGAGQQGIEINHVNQADAVVPQFGDCGEAARWLRLTLAIQRGALLREHVLLAEFDADVLKISFIVATAA